MDNHNNEADAEPAWQRVEKRVKSWIYELMHELSQSQIFTVFLYKVLVIIETCQFLWYCFHPNFTFLWDLEAFDWIRQVLRYTQFDGILMNNSETLFLACLYFSFGLTIILVIIAIVNVILFAHRKDRINEQNSVMISYSLKILSSYNLLLNTVLSFPFYYIFIATFVCHEDDSHHGGILCYQGTYYIHIAVAIIGITILLLTSFIFGILSVDLNPWSKVPYAAPGSRMNIIKLVFKIIIVLYINLDYNATLDLEFCVFYCILWLLILIMRFRQTPCYNRSVFNFVLGNDATIFWASLVTLFHAIFDKSPPDNMGLLFFVLGIPPVVVCYIVIVGLRGRHYRTLHIKNFKRDSDVEMYLLNVISMIETRTITEQKMSLEGLLKFHIKFCPRKEEDCVCYSLARDYKGKDEAPEKLWYLWTRVLVLEAIEKFPKSARLRILHAFIEKEKLDNKFKALFELMLAQKDKPSLEEEFSIHTYKNVIEREMVETEIRNIEQRGGIDVNLIVDFQKKFIAFQTGIETSTELHLDFWKELQETNPEIEKLHSLGSRITHSVEETSKQFKRLSYINSNHVRMLQIYGTFLRDVVNDELESIRILEKAEYADKTRVANLQFLDSDKLKYGENSDACVFIVDCHYNNTGTILNVNNEVTRILGYPKLDVIGHNINIIMPKVIAEIHDQFIRNYFETSQGNVIGIERIVFPLTKEGFILPCTIMIKVLPNLSEGIRVVGFISEIQKDPDQEEAQENDIEEKWNYMMYDGNSGIIYGISPGCKQDFGISLALIDGANRTGNEFTIESVFPNFSQIDPEELKTSKGTVVTIDTKNLRENFMTAINDSEDEQDANADKNKKYKIMKVKVKLIQDESYMGTNVRVIKFTEAIEEAAETQYPTQTLNVGRNENAKKRSFIEGIEKKLEEEAMDKSTKLQKTGSVAGSELDSSAAEINEEIRLIKDFRSLISSRTTPRSIRILNNSLVFGGLVLLCLSSLQLGFKFNQLIEFRASINAITDVYKRHNIMAEANYGLRKLDLLAKGILNTPTGQTLDQFAKDLRSKVVQQAALLSDIILKIEDYQEAIIDKGFTNVESDAIQVESLVLNLVKLQTNYFSNSLTEYISRASTVTTSPLAYFTSTDERNSTRRDFYYTRRNGYGSLRQKSEENALKFFNFYNERADTFDARIRIIMIFALIVLAASEFILIPIVFSVHKTATRVLSLFGFIPIHEVRLMAEKCERFMENFLEDHKKKKNLSFEDAMEEVRLSKSSRHNGQVYMEVSQNPDVGEDASVHQEEMDDLSYGDKMNGSMDVFSPKNPNTPKASLGEGKLSVRAQTLKIPAIRPSRITSPKAAGDGEKSMENSTAQKIKNEVGVALPNKNDLPQGKQEEKKLLENEEDDNNYNARNIKLMNSKNANVFTIFSQFFSIGGLFLAFYLADYFHNLSILKNTKIVLDSLRLNSERQPDLRFFSGLTLEELAEGGPQGVYNYTGQPFVNIRNTYKSLILTNLQALAESKKRGFPGSFDTYFERFNALSSSNLCQQVYYPSVYATESDCNNVASGLLREGLVIVTTRIIQIGDDTLKDPNTFSTNLDKKAVLNSQNFMQIGDLLYGINPILTGLLTEYMTAFSKFHDNSDIWNKVKFAIFVLLEFFVFIFLWLPFKRNLNDKIFRTKGMLKMIPIDIILKDENLKTMFLSGSVLQAVK